MTWTLVTGGAKRLGAEICRTLAKSGHQILIHFNNSSKEAEDLRKQCQSYGIKSEYIQGCFSTPSSTAQFIKDLNSLYPNIHNLINNVGKFYMGPASNTPPEIWQDLFQVNLHAPLALIHSLSPSIKELHGNIINIGVAGVETLCNRSSTAYHASKLALLMAIDLSIFYLFLCKGLGPCLK
jgi:NAD(P)-dependent dehydrogenase (short-subunit alcohol dehydrogenase family)